MMEIVNFKIFLIFIKLRLFSMISFGILCMFTKSKAAFKLEARRTAPVIRLWRHYTFSDNSICTHTSLAAARQWRFSCSYSQWFLLLDHDERRSNFIDNVKPHPTVWDSNSATYFKKKIASKEFCMYDEICIGMCDDNAYEIAYHYSFIIFILLIE